MNGSTCELSAEFAKRAEEELNETPENIQKCTEELRRLILGIMKLINITFSSLEIQT